ncbi:hypothetical protein DYU11_19250 [Fibrisoma montanum]|uniref:DUF1440 domain-containing protein n=1 Tax=Fibrisoma montanum TaxID=2305895 RepID=A0A418M6G9_9BACT|nr:hypothetical protein [Fibrisoma montanum]RIV21539.1 hypothetical protein DYU11_19250 [Fibrisoma montanum]
MTTTTNAAQALGSGLTGAIVLTILHETVRQFLPQAPRADKLGERALAKGFRAAGKQAPPENDLYVPAMIGDIASNALYYSLVGLNDGKSPLLLGAGLGAAAGLGAVVLPGPMGLGEKPTRRSTATATMTVTWYLVGGLVAGAAYTLLKRL